MTDPTTPRRAGLAYTTAVLGAFLIVFVLVSALKRYVPVTQLDLERAAARAKALQELRATEQQALLNVGWIDRQKGIVRLPVKDAMQLVEQTWGRDPAAARSNLIARVQKATAEPPKPPEPKSEFE